MLNAVYGSTSHGDIVIVMDDLNAKVGVCNSGVEYVVGTIVAVRNDHRGRFVDFCSTFTYLLTYLAITTCYRSWPELICGAIRHELLPLGANFGYPAILDSHQTI